MSFVTEWVKNVFLIVVAISFLEILLPESNMNKYLKFIFSIMILAIVISPLEQIHPRDVAAFESTSLYGYGSYAEESDPTVMLEAMQGKQIETVYREKLDQTIKDHLLNEFPGISQVVTEIYINNDVKSKGFGTVQKVTVYIDDYDYEKVVRGSLSSLLGLDKQKIDIKTKETWP